MITVCEKCGTLHATLGCPICALCGKTRDAHASWCAEVKERMEEKQGECPMCGCTNGEHRGHCMNFQIDKAIDEVLKEKKPDVAATLVERSKDYGPSFAVQCEVSQKIKHGYRLGRNWYIMTPDKREALEMIATKISRILNGNPDHFDSWHDIEGYARLISETLKP